MILGNLMDGKPFQRNLLPISSVSLLGSCETKFMENIEGRTKMNRQMKIGKAMHEKLIEGLPKISPEEILAQIKDGKRLKVRELPVIDNKYKLIGRIDELDTLGRATDGRNEGVIIDDKYPKAEYRGMPLYYKLQLSAYATAVGNSDRLGSICKVVGVRLICREAGTHRILKTFDVAGDELSICEGNVGLAASRAWELYEKRIAPEHRRFDVGRGDWVECYCNSKT